ncbi:MAG TPA: barstar family protein [Burkholderiales bacterium]|nr:barstar family protein [Burkholderiales bacterium]
MSKLLSRLRDARRSGVYRVPQADEVLDAVRGSELDVARIDLSATSDKEQLLAQFASSLAFPHWFGRNWDALEDCLSDLAWRGGDGHVLLIGGFDELRASRPDDFGVLLDILASSAQYWRERGKPFFVAFVDHTRSLALPDLFRVRSA